MYRNTLINSKRIAIGDSHTYGLGVQENEAWPYNLDAMNFGVRGCSTDLMARTAESIIKDTKAEVAYFMWSEWTRFEHYEGGKYHQILPTYTEFNYLYKDKTDDELKQNRENKIMQIEEICERNNVLMVSLYMDDLATIIDFPDRWPIAESTRSNPKPHYDYRWHRCVAELMKIKEYSLLNFGNLT